MLNLQWIAIDSEATQILNGLKSFMKTQMHNRLKLFLKTQTSMGWSLYWRINLQWVAKSFLSNPYSQWDEIFSEGSIKQLTLELKSILVLPDLLNFLDSSTLVFTLLTKYPFHKIPISGLVAKIPFGLFFSFARKIEGAIYCLYLTPHINKVSCTNLFN